MERTRRVSAVDEALERSPEQLRPSAPMLPPFRRPAVPPPRPPSAPARRSIGDSLPRRSILAPEEVRPSSVEYPQGRDSDERKSEQEVESDKRQDRRPRKKRRSRILGELRPVDGPESALPSVPAIHDDDSQDDDPLEALDSGTRAKEAFAAQRVRMRKSWGPDLGIYMKNAHPLLGICAAHRHHPYKRGNRFLVLLVALLVALLLGGLFAIRDCCTEVMEVPVAVVNRRLEMPQLSAYFQEPEGPSGRLRGGRRIAALPASNGLTENVTDKVKCLPFRADCSAASSVCAEGSTCRSGTGGAVAQCVPDEMPLNCVAGSCPTGWTCSANTNSCIPVHNYVCYPPKEEEKKAALNLAADRDGTFTAIEAIFRILQIAANNHTAEMQSNSSSTGSETQGGTAQQSQSLTSPPSTPSTTWTPTTSSSSRSDSASMATSSSSSSSASRSTAISSSSSQEAEHLSSRSASKSLSGSSSELEASESSTVKVTLTEPANGGVYTLSSTILIEWHLTWISGTKRVLENFRVDFSADNGDFDTIAANMSAWVSKDSNNNVFQFNWDLADNTSWLCTTCVLRICALDVESATDKGLCIYSDGQAASGSSRRRQTTVEGSSSSDVTFRIVREAFACSCGMGHASFLLAAVLIGACIPLVVLLAEPLVTFYRDRKVFGLFARRDGPVRAAIASYDSSSATRKGRVLLLVVLLALCVAIGFVAAQITNTNFLTEKGAIIVLWVVTFAIAGVLGVLVYCTLVGFVIFSFRWWRESVRDRREPSGLSVYRNSLLSSDVNANDESTIV